MTTKNKYFSQVFIIITFWRVSTSVFKDEGPKEVKNIRNQGFSYFFLLVDGRIRIQEAQKYTDPHSHNLQLQSLSWFVSKCLLSAFKNSYLQSSIYNRSFGWNIPNFSYTYMPIGPIFIRTVTVNKYGRFILSKTNRPSFLFHHFRRVFKTREFNSVYNKIPHSSVFRNQKFFYPLKWSLIVALLNFCTY